MKTVLLVDDEPDIRTIAELSLQEIGGWQVVLAESGPRALELASERRPDVILLDVMMPGMDGPTVLSRLREEPATARIPVVFLTAKVQKAEVERYVALGAAGVIHKPFDPLTLADELVGILDGSS